MLLTKTIAAGPMALALLMGAVTTSPSQVTVARHSCYGVGALVAGATGYLDILSTDIPPVAGLVAGATGYQQPTSWPPRTCS
jgi:hypothetical protein